MSNVTRCIEQRSRRDPDFAAVFERGYSDFKIGVLLRQAREAAGLTQEQVAQSLGTKKSAISRMENQAEEMRLSTLRAYAQAVDAKLQIQLLTA
ncbi:MAG: helix-turn-helix transcriptional regulator [Caldilineaceae bacterium]